MRRVAEALLALSPLPKGFTASELATQVRSLSPPGYEYGPRRATYDLKKFGAKQLAYKIEGSRRYEATPQGVRALIALWVLRDKVIQPLLAAAGRVEPPASRESLTHLDRHYETLRVGMHCCSKNSASQHEHDRQFLLHVLALSA